MMRQIGEAAVAVSSSLPLTMVLHATLIAAGALTAVCMARRSRASVRHAVLATAFIVLLALPVASVVMPARRVGIPILPAGSTLPVAGPTAAAAAVPLARRADPGAVRSTVPAPVRMSMTVLLGLGWIAGATLCLLPMITGLARVRHLRRTGLPWPEGQGLLTDIAAAAGIRQRVQLLMHDAIVGPMTCGVVRPAVVLPRDARGWDREALRRAMVHELEHIRRGDWFILCLARVACALYWFHPLVWMCWRRLRLDAERACDDAVLLGAESDAYADQLVTLAERLASTTRPSLLAMANRGDLSARVSAVLDDRQPRGRAGVATIAAGAVCAIVLLTAVVPLRAVARPQVAANQDGNRPAFEVASIRVNRDASDRPTLLRPLLLPGGRVLMRGQTLRDLILTAYAVRENEVIGGPDWIRSTGYDLEARGPADMSAETARAMLRTLLADRFSLAVHRDQRELPIYVLTMAARNGQPGPQLRPAAAECAAPTRPKGMPPGPPPSEVPSLPVPLGVVGAPPRCRSVFTGGHFSGRAVSMDVLAGEIADVAGRPVVNRTGLTGAFDLDLSYTPELIAQPFPDTATAPGLSTALQEQLGLKLEAGRGPVDVLVIDGALTPTEN